MTTKENYGKAIVSVDVLDINSVEMRQMCELEQRIAEVLFSHINKIDANGKAIKPQYLNDDDLKLMYAILSVFTKEYESTQTSAFDDFLKEAEKPAEKPLEQQEKNKKSVSDPYHEDQTCCTGPHNRGPWSDCFG